MKSGGERQGAQTVMPSRDYVESSAGSLLFWWQGDEESGSRGLMKGGGMVLMGELANQDVKRK